MCNRDSHEIDLNAERRMDALDRLLLAGTLSQSAYDAECRKLDRYTKRAHDRLSAREQAASWRRTASPDHFAAVAARAMGAR